MKRFRKPPRRRSTQPGQHRPVLLDEALAVLTPQAGESAVDATVGWAGHAAEILKRLGPSGLLIGMDLDADNLPLAQKRLDAIGFPYRLVHGNFAGLAKVLGEDGRSEDGRSGADILIADLGMSSMQVDDPERGFSYRRDGALDMRMDRSRGRTAAQLLASLSETELRGALQEVGDEPKAAVIAAAIAARRATRPLQRTTELAELILEATGQANWRLRRGAERWATHPASRTFQTLRILVNRELDNLTHLLRLLPGCLNPGGRGAIITFHSGEDRLVKSAFKSGLAAGIYESIAAEPVRAGFREKQANPRSRSAKMRWAIRGSAYVQGS